jgi:hypothetical protein
VADYRELLAMLTAHGIDATKAPGGGVPELTQMDVAGMMAKCSPRETALLRAKYCGDPRHDAWAYWFEYVMAEDWDARNSLIDKFTHVTLDEFLDEPRCSACHGTQGCIIDSKWVVCPHCEGFGYVLQSERAIGRALGQSRLREPWTERLSWARHKLRGWELSGLSNIR